MRVKGLTWVGIKTSNIEQMIRLFRDVLGLPSHFDEADFAAFDLANGDEIEVFGPGDKDSDHFTTGLVVGFLVEDMAEARSELEDSGLVQFFGPTVKADSGGWSWAHFRAPDGNIYEITSGPHPTLG